MTPTASSDRQSLDDEVKQFQAEFDRIADTTSFNGRKLLDGAFGVATFHVGAEANQTISFSVSGARTNQMGQLAQATGRGEWDCHKR